MDAEADQNGPGEAGQPALSGEGVEPPFQLGYRPELDGMRALSIAAVLLMHAPVPGFAGGFLRGGWVGVDAFFVLSGFLITTLLLDEHRRTGRVSLRRFYMRRVLRLAPALFVLLVVWSGYVWLALSESEARLTCRQALVTLLYSSNWIMAFNAMPMYELAPTWSLAVEEQFYLVWPPICVGLLFLGIRKRGFLAVAVTGAILSAVVRLAMLVSGAYGVERLYYGSDTRADALLIGCIVGILASRGTLVRLSRYRRTLGLAAASSAAFLVWIALTMTQMPWSLYAGLFTVIAVAVAIILVWVLTRPRGLVPKLLSAWPLVWTGRRSYGIYLWHQPAAAAISSPLASILGGREPHWALSVGVFVATSLAVAAISFRYVEEPMLALKHRFSSVHEETALRSRVAPRLGDPVADEAYETGTALFHRSAKRGPKRGPKGPKPKRTEAGTALFPKRGQP